MTVTKATAMMLAKPPIISWLSKVNSLVPKVSAAPRITERATATPTPAQTYFSAQVRWVLTRKAMRMTTTSAASRPSRSPTRALAMNTDSKVRLT